MSDLFKRMSALSAKQYELLMRRLNQEKAEPPALRLVPLPRTTNSFPLSYAQQRLWFLDQLDPGSVVYTIPTAVLLSGPLDIGALKASLESVVRRHKALRTRFIVVDGQLMQQVQVTSCCLPIADLQGLPATERERLVQQLILAETQRPFDLVNGPLLHMLLLRVERLSHVLILTMHHIVSDGWSMGVLAREISASYAAQRAGRPEPLPDLPIQYADFASWQRQWLQGTVLESQLGYWRAQLADLPQLDLPVDHPHPPNATFQAARQLFQLAPTLYANVMTFSRAADVTLFMTLLAAFQVLLSRYARQDDIVVGSPIANRTRVELEPLIGFFANTLVLRTDLSGGPTFRTLLQRVRAMTLNAYAHQDLPFEKLVEELQPERNLSSSPLFQVMFVMQNIPIPSPDLVGLIAHPLTLQGTLAKFDLTLEVLETAQGLRAVMEYKTALFDAPTINRMQQHFLVLLAAGAAAPDTPISRLPLLTPAEQHQLVVDWNATATDYPRDAAVHLLIEVQVERTPDMVAVLYEDQQITYRELNTRANQLAQALRAHGIDSDGLIALSMERAPEMIIAILGIHKAGGAYMPLDPTYPAERLAFMLADSRASVLITAKESDKETMRHGDMEIVPLRVSVSPCLRVSQTTTSPQRLAYVIYTSGSTGVPKGVMVTQRGLLNLCYGLRTFFSDPAVQRTGLITSISFDISVNQIFPTLLFGRTLHIIPDAVKYDSVALLPYIAAHRIELLDGVPSYFQLVLQAHAPARIHTALRYLLIGGEKIEAQLRDAIFDQLGPQVALVNIYGLTELSDINAFALHTATDRAAPISVGRPLQNNQIYILDHCDQPLPIGLVGEVCIAGESLARGYLGRPDLTAERFLPNPFVGGKETGRQGDRVTPQSAIGYRLSAVGTQLFRTGDLARYRPDGLIEILGRLDDQVKLRGHRIEVSEIEIALVAHPAVREVVVLAREDQPGDKRLVAYVVSRQRSGISDQGSGDPAPDKLILDPRPLIPNLRAFLKERLPSYMLPTAFVALATLPRTPNGKIDRRALPAPDHQPDPMTYVAPCDETEAVLAQLWSELLGVAQVGVHDNFFELGGHSLLATRLVLRLRERFAIDLPLRSLFEAPTVAGLAEQVEALQWAAQEPLVLADSLAEEPPEGEL